VTSGTPVHRDPFERKRRITWVALVALTIGVAGASVAIGSVSVPLGDVAATIGAKFGLSTSPGGVAEAVVWDIRIPRLVVGFATGAALGVVGAMLQGVLRNEMADPHLLGIGPGAAIGAALGASGGGTRGAIAGGVAAGVLTAFVLRRLARGPAIDRTRIILSGAALSLALGAWVGFVVFGSDRGKVPPLEFWLLGSVSSATWSTAITLTIFVSVAIGGMLMVRRTLDVVSLGEKEAGFLGVDTELLTSSLLIVAGATVGATVGAVGVIAFVGLVVPLVLRRGMGHSYRHVLPASIVGGGIFVMAADLVARSVLSPIEVPVGLVTAAVGGPVFLWLIRRNQDA